MMNTLTNKVDFAVIMSVKNANPNGDPLNGNRPRTNYEGYGEMSDVCLKRKIRNRLQDMGESIFVQSDDNRMDNYPSLLKRAEGVIGAALKTKDNQVIYNEACEKWIDVRAFGQVFAFSSKDAKGVSVGVRGPVSIQSAFSVLPVDIESIQITKSVSGEGDGTKRGSDTMGTKHRVDYAMYVTYGSINPQLASRTGFTDDDAAKVKEALVTLFENDASSARPEGSMEVCAVVWWEHNENTVKYSSAKVHRSLVVRPLCDNPKSVDDYEISVEELPELKAEIIDGI